MSGIESFNQGSNIELQSGSPFTNHFEFNLKAVVIINVVTLTKILENILTE